MKKLGVVILILAMVLGVVASLAGCGTSKDKTNAKQYMADGDSQMVLAKTAWEKILADESSLATASGDQVNVIGQDMQDNAAALATDLAAAKVSYDQILALGSDVQDYKDYVTKEEDIIKAYNDLLTAANKIMETYGPQLTAGTIDIMSLLQSPEIQAVMSMQTAIQKQEKDAASFKSEKKLAQ